MIEKRKKKDKNREERQKIQIKSDATSDKSESLLLSHLNLF